MAEKKGPNTPSDVQDSDFQFVLSQLLDAYKPVLELDLKRAQSSADLIAESGRTPQSCEEEIALANEIFGKFLTEETVLRLLPVEGRKLLGPVENWRWCLNHARCCIIFGWLYCRGPRTFRAFAYYLFLYFRCIRRTPNTQINPKLTDEERLDFRTLVDALAVAYKPYLTDQLATVEFPYDIPEEVIQGKIDCSEGQQEAAAIFERLLSANIAPALLGKEAFNAQSRLPYFSFCRCWCLCSIRFGCCLARARSILDVYRCLLAYFNCVRNCFRPLIGEIDSPA